MNDGHDSAEWYERHAAAVNEERTLGFAAFGYGHAWDLGSMMVAAAMARKLPLTIAIIFSEQRVFHAALDGSSACNDDWLARKFRAVAKHNCSSWALACQYRASRIDYYDQSGCWRDEIALAGGAVPLRVQGSLVGAVGVSGLAEIDDHRFVVDALRSFQPGP